MCQKLKFLLVLVPFILSSCSSDGTRVYWPNQDMADQGDSQWFVNLPNGNGIWAAEAGPNRVFVNFEGATVTSAQSFIVERAGQTQVVIPAFQPSDVASGMGRQALIDSILQSLRDEFSDLDIELVTTQPTEGKFHVVHAGGSNFTGRPNLVGISPLDVGNVMRDDVLFAFAREYASNSEGVTLLTHTLAHEIGHALGGRHIDNSEALLNPAVLVSASFFDREGALVAGNGTENTHHLLQMTLGRSSVKGKLTSLPELANLAIYSDGNLATLSVYHPENLARNPSHNLNDFEYEWAFQSLTAKGTTIRTRFVDPPPTVPQPVRVTVSQASTGEKKTFTFSVGGLR